MSDFITQYVEYLPWIVLALLLASAIGIPIGEDLVLVPAGILIGEQMLGPQVWVPTLVAGVVGVASADLLWFTWCSVLGTRLLHRRFFRRLVHPKRLLQAKHQVDRRGIWVIVAARFVPGSRTPAITVAGLMHLSPWKFAIATIGCVLLTAPMQLGVGVLIGYGIASRDAMGTAQWIIAAVVSVLVIVVLVVLVIRHRNQRHEPPRARAEWLRRYQ